MNVDALSDEVLVGVLLSMGHVSTLLACWLFYRRMKHRYPSTRISYSITDIWALTLAIGLAMGLILRVELAKVDHVGLMVMFLPSQVAGAFCAQIWMRARAATASDVVSSFIGTFTGALLGFVVFPLLGTPLFFIGVLGVLILLVTFPFGLILVVAIGLAYKLRTRVPLLPRVEASDSHPKSPQDSTLPPKN